MSEDDNRSLFPLENERAASGRGGPINRMNDLPYSDWMKFQKSFFWVDSTEMLIRDCVTFFTKSRWPDGRVSESLLLAQQLGEVGNLNDRRVEILRSLSGPKKMLEAVRTLSSSKQKYDFLFADMRGFFLDPHDLDRFLTHTADPLFFLFRDVLRSSRYCAVILDHPGGPPKIPAAWSVALSSRAHLRLRDEKIGLKRGAADLLYCLFMQAERDERPKVLLTSTDILTATDEKSAPAWIIPKPPPRTKAEILHPAKFPETLISQFIEFFTAPGESVFDPMAGTGSAVIAAIRSKRNGYGIELNEDFAEIARKRVALETAPGLFAEANPSTGLLITGNALKIREIPELRDFTFNYAVTSPPYWSMLANPGSENQEARRKKGLQLVYSDHADDVGNIDDYDTFLQTLVNIYDELASKLASSAHLTVIVKNVKRNHILYPLAWDLVRTLAAPTGSYEYAGTTLWCQDDIALKPFAVGTHWVSNILHQYCLHFRVRSQSKHTS